MERFQRVRQFALRLFAELVPVAGVAKRGQRVIEPRIQFRQAFRREERYFADKWNQNFFHVLELPGQARTTLRRRRSQQNMPHFSEHFCRHRDNLQIGIFGIIGPRFLHGGHRNQRNIGQFRELRQIIR